MLAEVKNSHGLRRPVWEGELPAPPKAGDKVTISRLWQDAVQNIKRLIKHYSFLEVNSIYIALKQFHFRARVLLIPVRMNVRMHSYEHTHN